MKRIIAYISLIILFTFLGIYGLMHQPREIPPSEILNIDYYYFDHTTGNYEKFNITEQKVTYNGSFMDLTGCESYNYKSSSGIVKTSCGKAFRIDGGNENGLFLEINNERYLFYSNKENSYKYEFNKYFNVTPSVYETQGLVFVNGIKLTYDALLERISSPDTGFVYLKTPSCTNECVLFNQAFSKFSENSSNLYYVVLNTLNTSQINEFASVYNTKLEDKDNPQVLVIKNNRVLEIIDIDASTFDLSKYEGFADNYGVENEENN